MAFFGISEHIKKQYINYCKQAMIYAGLKRQSLV
jgi:hypothetical protein